MTRDKQRPNGRIQSLDQFRGYCVVAMFFVNYFSRFDVSPSFLKHHNTYFSYADSIMPAFLFVVGISFRLTVLRRLERGDLLAVIPHYVRRCLTLVLISLVLYGTGQSFDDWSKMDWTLVSQFLAGLFKAGLWEVLAIIGVSQLCVLPLVATRPAIRVTAIVLALLLHAALSQWFNFAYVLGQPNPVDEALGTTGLRAWDGGLFGLIPWSVAVLAGTLAYDVTIATGSPIRRVVALGGAGLMLMLVAYGLSCLSTTYDDPGSDEERGYANSPVIPRLETGQGWQVHLAEPPFTPSPVWRPWNYWMMSKRVVTAPYILFGIGFAFATYALFVAACDAGSWRAPLLQTFGQQALVAYAIHHLVLIAVTPLIPRNSPVYYVLTGFAVFFGMTYACVRQLERQNLFIRL